MVKCYRKSVSLSDLWVSTNDKLSDFYTSSWQRGESPIPMLVLRVFLSALAMAILVWSLVEGANRYWLMFLTNWGLLLITMTMLSATLTSIMALCKNYIETDELPWFASMYWFLFNTTAPIAFIITALFWILIYNPDPSDEYGPRLLWLDIVTHGFNSCIMAVEILVSRTPVRVLHVYQPLGLGMWYAIFSVVYYAAGGTDGKGNPFIYEVLDWRQGRRAGIIVAGAVAGLIIIYVTMWGVAICRDKISTALVRTISHDLPLAPPDMHTPIKIV